MAPRLLLLLLSCWLALPAQAQVLLRIDGLEGELLANVQAYIGPREETERMSFRALSRHADEKAREALQALGYYNPRIETARETSGDTLTCVVTVDPGPPVRITRADFRLEGGGHDELQEFIDTEAPRPGEVFHHGRYEAFKSRLLQAALVRGYFDVRYARHEARVDITRNEATLVLELVPGARHRFGALTIEGEGLRESLLVRFPRFRAGDWYDATLVAELHRDLVRAGWFETVRIQADPDPAGTLTVPVTLRYSLRQRNRVGLGVGASTDIGPRFKAQWEKPWLNSRGHSLSSYLEVSQVRSQLEASYLVPLNDPVTSQLALTYGLQYEDLNDYDYWLTTAGVEHRKRLRNGWRLTRGVSLERETDDFGLFEASTTLLIPGVTLSRTESEGSPLISRGWRAVARLQYASDLLFSDAEMLRASGNAKAIHSFGERVRGIARIGGGAMKTPDILDIPISLRFFAGGDQSIRGYDYRSIGPEDAQGNVIGGRYNLEGSAEVDLRFAERWLAAAFIDSGTAFDDLDDTQFFNGVGVGVRWLSPIGPLRLDFAWGVSREDTSFNLHFYMGPEL